MTPKQILRLILKCETKQQAQEAKLALYRERAADDERAAAIRASANRFLSQKTRKEQAWPATQ